MCCGKMRTQFREAIPNFQPPSPATVARPQPGRYSVATFEYIGRTRLTVAGPVTGREYRFERPGARMEVDPRDRASIASVPLLRQLGQPPPRVW